MLYKTHFIAGVDQLTEYVSHISLFQQKELNS